MFFSGLTCLLLLINELTEVLIGELFAEKNSI